MGIDNIVVSDESHHVSADSTGNFDQPVGLPFLQRQVPRKV
jgi:hypothetical protein